MPERPKYSTGFRIFGCALAVIAIGILPLTYGAPVIGAIVVVVGLFIANAFRWPSDWRKTWPDDFPVTARLFGLEADPDRWAQTSRKPTWWETAPAPSRLAGGVAGIVCGAALLGAGIDWGWDGLLTSGGALVMILGVARTDRALRDL